IYFKGIVSGNLIFTADSSVVKNIINNYLYEEISKEEEKKLMEDILEECISLIFDKSIDFLNTVEDSIVIGYPTTLILENNGKLKLTNSTLFKSKICFSEGDIYLFAIFKK
ncbi:MAG: hypothetical protein ABF289_19835, partial [Clostridiales bacterium]